MSRSERLASDANIMVYKYSQIDSLWCTLMVMKNFAEKKKTGRPELPVEQRRTGRLAIRTYPDVEEKARRVGTENVEAAICRIKEPHEGAMGAVSSNAVVEMSAQLHADLRIAWKLLDDAGQVEAACRVHKFLNTAADLLKAASCGHNKESGMNQDDNTNGAADALADRLMRLHRSLEDRGDRGNDWSLARALEDRIGAYQPSKGDFDRAESLLQKHRF